MDLQYAICTKLLHTHTIGTNFGQMSYVIILQTPEENYKLTIDAQKDVQNLLNVILSREYSSGNLESIFKVFHNPMT